MGIPGQRVTQSRWIESDKRVIEVEVELVYPIDDPSEPCFDAAAIKKLREAKEEAERGEMNWLALCDVPSDSTN